MHQLTYRAVSLAVAVLAFTASTADAHPFTPKYEAAYVEALNFWGSEPENCISLSKEIVPVGTPRPRDGETNYWGLATQPTEPVDCILWVVSKLPSDCALEHVMRHEVGHLLGYGHSDDPSSPMNTDYAGGCPLQIQWQSYWGENGVGLEDRYRASDR